MNVNESVFLCTHKSILSEHEVKLLEKQRTRDLYQVNMILDNLPAMRFASNKNELRFNGLLPVGYAPPNSNEDYIINHLKFRFLVHEYEGAGVLDNWYWGRGYGCNSGMLRRIAAFWI
ncbi:Transmembrane 9 superfamily member 12 [Camellia lanceoleosa]|nr:Transmembrane 9 superfamily member 12 [Camellia lanceoleosa]